ncbi:branched-chain amino acid transaminase [Psychrosphaera sp. B3R10]|uniref:branched-chain amino acid transaminase n=1 Tax=unclassified Psychrosphaera TaxID=2641570 RepID=UPI001C0A07BB|nr:MULTISPECIES: branched-chain amino acid transaminase [unclassified Psychrosphaera]MBU2883264.1 branched-chain amino acid transaminase [Psychrosphaera sp. I2R16]MBU2990642.1 branched-chain amino acid transaminase [Psychrosphaera sp. B3R10]MDO6718884.1 branched-chain amino acid transaminase [Psychrosphaera sp. 1_MG-2023]
MALSSSAEKIWFNGKLIPFADAKVHVLSHAIHYGSSVFEGVRAYDTPDKGTCIFRLEDHTRRLFDSAKIYRMTIPHTMEELNQAQKDVVVQNGFKSAYLRPAAFYGEIGLGLAVPFNTEADVIVAAMEWGAYLGEEALENGVDAGVSSWNRLAANTMPTGAKAGGNYLSSQLISMEARRHGYGEGIALDVHGYVSEGAGENLFVIRDGVVTTTPITAAILPGLTRDTIIKLLKELGYVVREQNIPREALYLADEVLMCGTAAEVTPVRSVDGIEVGSGKRGPITKQIQEAFFGLFNGTTEDKWGWLTPVK